HAGSPQYGCAFFVCDDEIMGRTAVPGSVDSDRVRDDHYTFAGSLSSQNVLKYVCIGRERTDNDVRLKLVEDRSKLRLQPNQSPKFPIVIGLAVEPAINESPCAWRRIEQRQIASAHQFVDRAVGFGK